MDKYKLTSKRLITLLLAVVLALVIGLAVAQTHSAAPPPGDTPNSVAQAPEAVQPSGDTPGTVAEKPADTPDSAEATTETTEAPVAAAEAPCPHQFDDADLRNREPFAARRSTCASPRSDGWAHREPNAEHYAGSAAGCGKERHPASRCRDKTGC